jgi:SAM-dependent methyltransferase
MRAYTPQAYAFVARTSQTSAAEVVPLLCRLARPRSVVDFGCGTGDWLAAFAATGATRVLGLDGPWVPLAQLAIPAESFRATDLRRPVQLDAAFDCALCLEVIGHVPKPDEATLLDSLVAAAPVVAFSAPIPGQGGIGSDATNREWPAYWADRFAQRGFVAVDCLRPLIWDRPGVAWWFAQNLFLAVREDVLSRTPGLARSQEPLRALVHPGCFESTLAAAALENRPLRQLAAAMVSAAGRQLTGRARG